MIQEGSVGVVFIHGAGLGSWIWKEVTSEMSFPTKTINFPKREGSIDSRKSLTLDDYTTHAVNQLKHWKIDKVVVVAHSLGGVVGLKIAQALGNRLAGFVGIAAAIPINGGTFLSCLPFPKNIIMMLMMRLAGTKVPRSALIQGLCNDLSPEQTKEVVTRFVPESIHIYTDKCNAKAPKTKTLYVSLTKDHEFGKSLQKKMVSHLHNPQVVTLDTGHMPMLKEPKNLAEIINKFITKT